MASGPVKNKKAIVTGDPNSPLGFGRKRYFTCTYDHTVSPNLLQGMGQLKNGDMVYVAPVATSGTAGYGTIIWDSTSTVYDPVAGVVGLKASATEPGADVDLVVVIEDL